MFPSLDYRNGLSDNVTLSINSSCAVTGTGNLAIYINNETSETLLQTVDGHCEEREKFNFEKKPSVKVEVSEEAIMRDVLSSSGGE